MSLLELAALFLEPAPAERAQEPPEVESALVATAKLLLSVGRAPSDQDLAYPLTRAAWAEAAEMLDDERAARLARHLRGEVLTPGQAAETLEAAAARALDAARAVQQDPGLCPPPA